jgi:hypothetical protein
MIQALNVRFWRRSDQIVPDTISVTPFPSADEGHFA